METVIEILSKHIIFKDLKPEFIEFLHGCASEVSLKAGTFVFKSREPAEQFYLITSGKIALEVYSPPKGPLNILTLNSQDILGWSWLHPPYRWHFDAQAITDATAYRFDADGVRRHCREDYEFGYMLTNCFGQIMMQRLAATRLQLLDLFGKETVFPHYHH